MSIILICRLLEPLRVAAVDRAVPSPVAWSSLAQFEPPSTETCRVSPDARAALSVAVTVCAAVLVMKSDADDPVSAEMSTELIVVVGATASYQALTSASVAEFPATPNNSTVQSSNDSPKNEDDAFNLNKYK